MNWYIVRLINKIKRFSDYRVLFLHVKHAYYKQISNNVLTKINLSIASVCSSDCIYCPSNRGKSIKDKFMSYDCAKKIVTEISSPRFRSRHNVHNISIGENGDAFLNKEIIKILRLLRSELPYVRIICYTNFRYFDKHLINLVLKEKLIDFVGCNIDGSNEESYFKVKKTNFNTVKQNLLYFISIRRQLKCDVPLHIYAMTLFNYVNLIQNNLGVYPIKAKEYENTTLIDDYEDIEKELSAYLDHPKESFKKACAFGWAERDQFVSKKIKYDKYCCPLLERIKNEAFIAPNGAWYVCCYDANNEIVLGNVMEKSLDEIYKSRKYQELIQLLENREFNKIGGPCKTVNCCQSFS